MAKRPSSRQKFAVDGADELQAALSRLSNESRPKIMRAGLDVASSLVLDEMQARVPRDTGKLRSKLVRWINVRKGEVTSAAIGPKKVRGQWWAARARWLEYGTRDGKRIRPRNTKAITPAPGEARASAEHRGIRAQPFMRPALDNNVQRIYRVMADAMWGAIKRVTP
jgi:HK97 gp10 family phage protein